MSHFKLKVVLFASCVCLSLFACGLQADESEASRPTMQDVMESSTDDDWRAVDSSNTLYMKLRSGMVVMELAPAFAPNVIENIRELVLSEYFDGTAIVRSQENYVIQWADPLSEDETKAKPIGDASETIAAEFFRALEGVDFVPIDSVDTYADRVGFVNSMPTATDDSKESIWLTHCHGMLGVARGNEPESGNGTSLYVLIGHAPRHLDKNVVLIGRVLHGMELLSTLQRGTGALGFYESEEQMTPIEWIKLADDIPMPERLPLQVFRTDTQAFKLLVESRRYRAEEWFVDPTGNIELCNVPLPVRVSDQ